MSPDSKSSEWTQTLVAFLQSEPALEAVRLDTESRRVQVATLGDINEKALRQRLEATLQAIDAAWPTSEADVSPPEAQGFTVRLKGTRAEVASPSCETAPKFWTWREFAWPDPEESTDTHDHEDHDWRFLAVLAGLCGGLGIGGWLVHGFAGGGLGAQLLTVAALIAGGWDAAIDSWENIKKRKLDIHFLMLAVAAGAVTIGAWHEAVLLLFLFSASGAMEAYALDRTHRAVDSLLQSAPKRAWRVRPDGEEEEVPVESLELDDLVSVKAGSGFPADGEITKGTSASDESALTGESVPVEKSIGDAVYSGTLNLWGSVVFRVQRLPAESTLQKIIRLIQTAQKLRAPSERFTDKFGGRYTLLVLGVCTTMFLVWWLGLGLSPFTNSEETTSAFYRAMTLLVVMSPCALVLSIPSAILAAIAWGARHGVLFRGGGAIEKLAGVRAVALDKTGTLTTGELEVLSYESLPAGREDGLMSLALALEANSTHPIARAIVRDARARGAAELDAAEFESITGQGVKGRVGDSRILLGRRELLQDGPLGQWAQELPPAAAELAEVWVVSEDLVGRVLLRDQIRQKSQGVLAELRALGIHTVMLTGDRRQTAEKVAAELGLDEVRAGLAPEDKVKAVTELRERFGSVSMVGDGVNDAPSLAAADVSVAMGARGSDAALEQAEVILMEDRIENVLSAITLSRRAKRVIVQNLSISMGVVFVMAIASLFGIVPLGLGVAAHEGSTVVVCLNSLRLLWGNLTEGT